MTPDSLRKRQECAIQAQSPPKCEIFACPSKDQCWSHFGREEEICYHGLEAGLREYGRMLGLLISIRFVFPLRPSSEVSKYVVAD